MSRVLRVALWTAVAGAGPVLLAAVFLPGRREVVFDLYLLLVGGAIVASLVKAVSSSAPTSAPEPREAPVRAGRRLPELDRTERAVFLGAANAFDLHYRLRPILREVAAQRLATRRGLELDRDVDAARLVVGEAAWELVRPEREPPELRHDPGLQTHELAAVVTALEKI